MQTAAGGSPQIHRYCSILAVPSDLYYFISFMCLTILFVYISLLLNSSRFYFLHQKHILVLRRAFMVVRFLLSVALT